MRTSIKNYAKKLKEDEREIFKEALENNKELFDVNNKTFNGLLNFINL
jgi:hypothetical protein